MQIKSVRNTTCNIIGDKTYYDRFIIEHPGYSHLNSGMLNTAASLPRNMPSNFDDFCKSLRSKYTDKEKSVLYLYYNLIRSIEQ